MAPVAHAYEFYLLGEAEIGQIIQARPGREFERPHLNQQLNVGVTRLSSQMAGGLK
jgi:hypothetical protein